MHYKWMLLVLSCWLSGAFSSEAAINKVNALTLQPDIRTLKNPSIERSNLIKARSQRALIENTHYTCTSPAESSDSAACLLIELGDAAAQQDMRTWVKRYSRLQQDITAQRLSLGQWDDYFKLYDQATLDEIGNIQRFKLVADKPLNFLAYGDNAPQLFEDPLRPYLTDSLGNKWLVDTGASQTLINADVAKVLGARAVAHVSATLTSFHSDAEEQGRLAVIDSLTLGEISIEAVTGYIYSGESVIGLDLLKKLGSVAITKNGVYVWRAQDAPTQREDCSVDVYLGSNILNTNQYLFTGITLDNKKLYSILDTGVSGYLRKRGQGAPGVKHLDTGKDMLNSSMGYFASTPALIGIGGISKNIVAMEVAQARYPAAAILGFDLLNDFDLFIDFNHKNSCLVKHSDPSSTLSDVRSHL